VPKRIYNVVEYDTYAEIPAIGAEGLIHCIEDGKVYCREGNGSLHEPANSRASEAVHDHDSDYSTVGHSHSHDHNSDYAATVHAHVHNHDGSYAAPHAHPYSADNHTHPGGSEAFPVGAVFLSVVSTSPTTLLGYGTWSQIAGGRMLVGQTNGDADFDVAEETGGAKTHTLTTAEMPVHTHVQDAHGHNFLPRSATTGSVSSIVTGTLDTSSTISGSNQPHVQSTTAVNQNAGSGSAHNNMPPYLVVYMWKRTA
jgi:hypothetical protein